MTKTIEVPVLIVGAGPSGATTALLLANQGISSLVISKHKSSANTPRAHIFNQRAMEVLRDAGIQDQLADIATPATDMQHTSWLSRLNGDEFGRIWSWGNKPEQLGDYIKASPCVMSDIPQSRLEPVLVAEAKKRGAEFRFYTEFLSLTQDTTKVVAKVRNRATLEEYMVNAQYLVGADGARSHVLQSIGIPIIGKQINTAFNVHIKADLTKFIAHRPGSLNWVINTEAPGWSAVGNFRMVHPWDEFVVSMHPATKDIESYEPTHEELLQRLYSMIGDDSIPIKILSHFSWSINDQVAERWQKDRVLCIGDATHRHPPINGLGSNTCISDAFNISWKLAYVLKGHASPQLLNTLTAERKPVGDAVVRRANQGMEAHRRLWAILGLTAETRREAMSQLSIDGPTGAAMRKSLRDALEAVEDEVQALGIQMNQIYDSSAVLHEIDDIAPDFSDINCLREQAITTFPGYHLPHVWIAKDALSAKISTLDLCGHGCFTLLTGLGGDQFWKDAAKIVSNEIGIKLNVYSIGFGCEYMDCYHDWRKVCDVDDNGVVLVRPDHFVGWRSKSVLENGGDRLLYVLKSLLGYN